MASEYPGHFFTQDPLIYFFSMNIPENLFSLIALLIGFCFTHSSQLQALRLNCKPIETSC